SIYPEGLFIFTATFSITALTITGDVALVGSFLWAATPKPQPIFSKKPKKPKKNQNTKRPRNCPFGTKDIDKVKKDKGWDKDKLHGIKDAAHDGMGKGDSWTGVAPDGTVGINEYILNIQAYLSCFASEFSRF
ncbi:MAG: hypothetical protein WBM35_00720, partial [Candidatus Electrothrix sp.]